MPDMGGGVRIASFSAAVARLMVFRLRFSSKLSFFCEHLPTAASHCSLRRHLCVFLAPQPSKSGAGSRRLDLNRGSVNCADPLREKRPA